MSKRNGLPSIDRLREMIEDAPTVEDSKRAIDMLAWLIGRSKKKPRV